MATSNIKKKIAALAELNIDPASAIELAWSAVSEPAKGAGVHPNDVWLVGQVLGAVVADIREAAKPVTPTN